MKRILTFFLFLWIIIIAIPVSWMLFPIKKDMQQEETSLDLKVYTAVDQISFNKEDLLDRTIVRQAQLRIANKKFGRDPFHSEEFKHRLTKTTNSSLKKNIAYYNTNNDISGPLQLEGISYTSKAKIALINNSLVSEGEKINDYIVTKIRETGVELKKNDDILSLKLKDHTF